MNDNTQLIRQSVSWQNTQALYSATLLAGFLYPIYSLSLSLSLSLSVHSKLLQELVTLSFLPVLYH